jgi:hypothetical protein
MMPHSLLGQAQVPTSLGVTLKAVVHRESRDWESVVHRILNTILFWIA